MMFRVVMIKVINVKIIEIIKEMIRELIKIKKLIMKKIIKEVKWYLEDEEYYLKIGYIRVKKWWKWWCLIWIWW